MKTGWLLVSLAIIAIGTAPPSARAESVQVGNVLASFRGGFFPTFLPRTTAAPIKIHFAGDVKSTTPGSAAPPLTKVTFAINSAGGVLLNQGLDVCHRREVQFGSEEDAKKKCGSAIVGSGSVTFQVRLPNQSPVANQARVLFYNSAHHGVGALFAQAYSRNPPASFIIPVLFSRQRGVFGTVVTTTVPRSLRSFVYFKHFDMLLQRTYLFRGKRRSLLSAACAAPAGFPGAVFPVARITYDFITGQRLTTTIVRSCTVRQARGPKA